MQAPEKAALVAVDGVVQLPIAPGVTLLRGTTHNRLKARMGWMMRGTLHETTLHLLFTAHITDMIARFVTHTPSTRDS